MLRAMLHTAVGLAAALLASCGPAAKSAATGPTPQEAIRVFAASSLTDVLKTVSETYAVAGHPKPLLNLAASSELARQIEHGGTADIFISADEAWMDHLADRELIDLSTRKTLATNTLVLIAPSAQPLSVEIGPGMDLAAALKGGKLAIANPDNVPAGKYATEALEKFGAWASVEKLAARAENVRAALRFVETGEAAAGIVYITDAMAAGSAVTIVGEFPADSHTPITYPAAVLAEKSGGGGKAFLDYLATDEAVSVFKAAGFGMP